MIARRFEFEINCFCIQFIFFRFHKSKPFKINSAWFYFEFGYSQSCTSNQFSYFNAPKSITDLLAFVDHLLHVFANAFVSTFGHFLFKSKSMSEFCITFYAFSCVLQVTFFYLINIFQTDRIFELIKNFEEFIEKRKYKIYYHFVLLRQRRDRYYIVLTH